MLLNVTAKSVYDRKAVRKYTIVWADVHSALKRNLCPLRFKQTTVFIWFTVIYLILSMFYLNNAHIITDAYVFFLVL